jgi:deoxyinosine 3'endonuclease (endonuclease V)
MGLLRKAVVIGVAKKVFDEARKPENQRRMKEAVDQFKARREGSRRRPQ